MKLMHISDLHIGKRLMDVSLLEDQKYILEQILDIMDREQPDALLIAGDVYDTARPSIEAVELMDFFLTQLARREKPVFIISGNHDSAERLTYARSFLAQSRIYISPVYNGHIEPIRLADEWGVVCFWLMPYVNPDHAAAYFPDQRIRNADEAARAVLSEMQPDRSLRNVILSHQFIVGGTTSDSERKSVGTLEDVSAQYYEAFDYVALGHLHRPQNVGRSDGTMRYCGTPLKYSRSECSNEKTVTMVEMDAKGEMTVSQCPLHPLRELRLVRGGFDALMQEGPEAGAEQDFYFVDLTDEEDIPNAAARLRERFPNMLAMRYDNKRTRSFQMVDAPEELEEKSPMQLMEELFVLIHKEEMSAEARQFVTETMKKVEGFKE
ncbi:MAG: exonuclease SbcCD subunit D [Lachnospiraceae bacterium]|nr:exonuclease SbcCD subunit D [Lachnospiraceae bacterium]